MTNEQDESLRYIENQVDEITEKIDRLGAIVDRIDDLMTVLCDIVGFEYDNR